ncbi:AAA family ATPase [Intrasporangium calvum]|uniref:AAA ATPase central domain protein n=1 Tax=Intrasporangium calvum (strain ATCC 23552 / DSM 43043 / JCM 3097 / NBRC 12989 / NCIMB 10167 / NRRL B-3866 / 7 KIP) TaxID=710696 RepID=E6S9B8_INTC7|nr:AAA family ATPase [Intrasporangium calvum]ADU47094.1 AAA ATPase central domain protein [Intrasporangium calvum DSM 43043]
MTTAETALADSLDALVDVARLAGIDAGAARDEGLRVAAALAESVPGAAREWAAVALPAVTDTAAINEAFFAAASRGRRWRQHPTDLLVALSGARHPLAGEYAEALTEIASDAVMLGTAPIWVIANATAASATYLAAATSASTSASTIASAGPSASPSASPSARPGGHGLPPLPPGVGTDAVLRQWGYQPVPRPVGSEPPSGSEPSGIRPGPDPAGAPADSAAPAAEAEAAEPAEPEKSVEELLAELDAMIGLGRVKKEIHRQVALLKVERMRVDAGLKAARMSRHLVFVGNPGTGKTTVARLVGAIYRALGLLPQGQLVEVDRSELVAGYVGQTAMKTAEVCAKAVGGVLFIDEAYALTGDQFAQEAVNTLVKEMEDHREDLVVIVAGYPEPMVRFIAQNPGLASRFTTTIEFDDYTDDELLAILDSIADRSEYELTDAARRRVRHTLEATARTPAFGNGRFVRNLFEHAVGRHAWRLQDAVEPTRDDLRLLTEDDVVEQPDEPPATPPTAAPEAAEDAVQVPVRDDPDGRPGSPPAGSEEDLPMEEPR